MDQARTKPQPSGREAGNITESYFFATNCTLDESPKYLLPRREASG